MREAGPRFTLTLVTSADGYIARKPGEPPGEWASAEEQELFLNDVEAADWAVMGRRTHEAADRPERRRIVFTTGEAGWRRPEQLWLDPKGLTVDGLAERVATVRRLRRGLILGGTRVHDWFLKRNSIARVHLTIEPVRFGGGLPIFSERSGEPEAVFRAAGFERASEEILNRGGTRYQVWRPRR